ncbi:MAG TPA: hypothetical protein VMG35_08105 [Bryobacteraceae bacterium]|nr:hypothetical protein [Bryobacteraceae bacterium]HUI55912.1 hypothetical protein [Bryobacteraceae bacterium]
MPHRDARILGGIFGLETPAPAAELARLPFTAPNLQYFLSVRCALLALCEARRPSTAWLPSYLCGVLRTPFERAGVAMRYYKIDGHLRVADKGWIGEIRAGDLVLAIHYFGIPQPGFPAGPVNSRGALLVEDASQALFLPRQFSESTGVLYSPRKFFGVPDGGILASREETGTKCVPLEEPPSAWWRSALAVSMKRREFDRTRQPRDWYPLFRQVEAEFPVGRYRSSDLSRTLIASVDYAAIRQLRRANYSRLLSILGDYALFPELGPDVVPCGFPVRVDPGLRDEVVRQLHAAHIYVPMHWPIDRIVPEEFQASHELARSCLTLLCDQRLTPADICRQAEVFQAAVRG